jgi:two-component system chemotaxis sensor kinase CheA
MKISLKTKIFLALLTLPLVGIGFFSYFSMQTYLNDKLAYVYSQFVTEVKSFSRLQAERIKSIQFQCDSLAGQIDPLTKDISPNAQRIFQANGDNLGFVVLTKEDINIVSKQSEFNSIWKREDLFWRHLPDGLSQDLVEKEVFYYRHQYSGDIQALVIVFKASDFQTWNQDWSADYRWLNLGQVSKDLNQVYENVLKTSLPYGLLKASLENKDFLVSFAKISGTHLYIIKRIEISKILLVQEVFYKQALVLFGVIASLAIILATLFSHSLTWRLKELMRASNKIKEEDFSEIIEISSQDEIGQLGESFNSMTFRIKNLLEELRKYNLELEDKVRARTKELSELNQIQKAMLNSLGQGFVLVNKDYNILPIYSKVAQEMFEQAPDQSRPHLLLGLSDEAGDSTKELISLAFNKTLEFDDVVKLLPDERTNSKKEKIVFQYAPINDSVDSCLEYFFIIGTDKTKEYESQENFKKEWNFSQMIMKIVANKFGFTKVLNEALEMVRLSLEVMEKKSAYPIKDVQRMVHTLKGGLSYFNMIEITNFAHQFETQLNDFFNLEKLNQEQEMKVISSLLSLGQMLEDFCYKYEDILKLKESTGAKVLKLEKIREFEDKHLSKDPYLRKEFRATFLTEKIENYFEMYPNLIKEIALKVGKEIQFKIEGAENELPLADWGQLFGQFIHTVRNSLDHGIETPPERLSLGKTREGHLLFKFEVQEDLLTIRIEDDGRGIHWEKLREKDPSIASEELAIQRIFQGGLSSKDEVSDLSGRGVGVSSLYAKVKSCGGTFEVENKPQNGLVIMMKFSIEETSKKLLPKDGIYKNEDAA